MQKMIAVEPILKTTLRAGTLIALTLIIIGGIWSLSQYGQQPIQPILMPSNDYQINILHLWSTFFVSPATGLIELGIITLVMLQVINIAILCVYYLVKRDRWYIAISFAIFLMLILSIAQQ